MMESIWTLRYRKALHLLIESTLPISIPGHQKVSKEQRPPFAFSSSFCLLYVFFSLLLFICFIVFSCLLLYSYASLLLLLFVPFSSRLYCFLFFSSLFSSSLLFSSLPFYFLLFCFSSPLNYFFFSAPIVWQKLIDNFDAEYRLVTNDEENFYFRTNLDAPRNKLILINLKHPEKVTRKKERSLLSSCLAFFVLCF